MKDKTLILLEKLTLTFNVIVDFLMEKTAILSQKLFWEVMLVGSFLIKKLIIVISFMVHKIEKTDDWKFFETNLIRFEKNILKHIPRPILEILVYILDSALYFVKTTLTVFIKLTRALVIETYKQIKKLPHAHQRFVFITLVVFIVCIFVFRDKQEEFDAFDEPYFTEELTISEDITPENIREIIKEIKTEIEKREVVIKYGDTLVDILQTNEVNYNDIDAVLKALRKCYNPKKLAPGKKIEILFKDDNFVGLELGVSLEELCAVRRAEDDSFEAELYKKELVSEIIEKQAVIKSSLFQAGEEQGLPNSVLMEFIKMYSWDVDFVRDIRTNDSFTILYERFNDQEGNFVKNGNIIYTNMRLSGDNIPIYKYKGDYFKEDGRNIRKALLRTPINGARVSSSFGRRKHPVMGYSKLHGGIDFAAPRGTPIYAAGDGKIVNRGSDKYNGNMVKIKHNSTYITAYAHMNKFASNQKVGSRVKQGQIIGYVGTTGRSTGNHLHYEIQKNGKKVNPAKVKLPNKQSLEGDALKEFKITTFDIRKEMGMICTPSKKPKS